MSVRFWTSTPNNLLINFKKAISEKHIVTWSAFTDGDFTHSVDQWKNKAYMRPKIYSDSLTFGIIKGSVKSESLKETYAIYHGRLVEAFLAHFDTEFTRAESSALLVNRDGDDLR